MGNKKEVNRSPVKMLEYLDTHSDEEASEHFGFPVATAAAYRSYYAGNHWPGTTPSEQKVVEVTSLTGVCPTASGTETFWREELGTFRGAGEYPGKGGKWVIVRRGSLTPTTKEKNVIGQNNTPHESIAKYCGALFFGTFYEE